MSNIRELHIIRANERTVESKLIEMKDLKDQITELTALYDKLKDEVIADHFNDHEEYKNENGRVLATYKGIDRTSFQQKLFEEAHPLLFAEFTKTQMSFRFDLKR